MWHYWKKETFPPFFPAPLSPARRSEKEQPTRSITIILEMVKRPFPEKRKQEYSIWAMLSERYSLGGGRFADRLVRYHQSKSRLCKDAGVLPNRSRLVCFYRLSLCLLLGVGNLSHTRRITDHP